MNWNFDIDSCPIDEPILLAAGEDWVGQAVKYENYSGEGFTFVWASGDSAHSNHTPKAWMHLPEFPTDVP